MEYCTIQYHAMPFVLLLYRLDDNKNGVFTTPGRTRTCDLRFRKPMLYPTELRAQIS